MNFEAGTRQLTCNPSAIMTVPSQPPAALPGPELYLVVLGVGWESGCSSLSPVDQDLQEGRGHVLFSSASLISASGAKGMLNSG